MAYYDFEKIKKDVSIERSLIYLKLKFKKDDNGWRAECPQCGGERSLAINPIKNVYFCHEADKGGDVLSFVSHVLDIGVKEAAKFLLEHSTKKETKKTSQVSQVKKGTVPQKSVEERGAIPIPTGKGFSPLQHLIYQHPKVQAFGLEPDEAKRMGIGYCAKGYYKSHVVAPLRLDDGHLVVYAILSPEKPMPKTLNWPATNVIPLKLKKRV